MNIECLGEDTLQLSSASFVKNDELRKLLQKAESRDYSLERTTLNQLRNLELLTFGVNDGNTHFTKGKPNLFVIRYTGKKSLRDVGISDLNPLKDGIVSVGEVEYDKYDESSDTIIKDRRHLQFGIYSTRLDNPGAKDDSGNPVNLYAMNPGERILELCAYPNSHIQMEGTSQKTKWQWPNVRNHIGYNTSLYPGPLYHWTGINGFDIYTKTRYNEDYDRAKAAAEAATYGMYIPDHYQFNFFFLLQYPRYVDKWLFYNALDTEADPVNYINILKCYKAAGLDSAPPDKIGLFREVVAARSLVTAFQLLNAAQIEDEYYIKQYYASLMGRILRDVEAAIASSDTISANSLSQNFPDVRYSVSFTENEKRQLLSAYHSAAQVIAMNLKDIEARIIQLETPSMPMQPTAFTVDPSRNPFLVYNEAASRKEGTPVFTNVAQNKNLNFAVFEKNIVAKGAPPVEAFERAPEVRARFLRNIPTETGSVSYQDLLNLGIEKENKSLWLWIAGGVATAAIASQVL